MGVPNSNPTSLSVVTAEFGGGGSMRAAAAAAGLSAPDGLAEFKGLSAQWSTTLTIGSQSAKPGTRYGYIAGVSAGSMNDRTVDTLSGTPQINEFRTGFGGTGLYIVWHSGLPTDWTSVEVHGTTINRSSFGTYGSTHHIFSGSYIPNSSGTSITVAFNT